MTSFTHMHLRGESKASASAESAVDGNFDFVLLCSSWDKRSVCLSSSSHWRSRKTCLLLFDHRDALGLRDAHDAVILSRARESSEEVIPIRGASSDLDGLWGRIYRSLVELRMHVNRPLRLLIDASACPRYFCCALLGTAINRGIAAHVSLFYAEGVYSAQGDGTVVSFTGGPWRSVPIAGLNGEPDPGKKRYYLISAGWEGDKTFKTVTESDPDRISLLLPDPGVTADYTVRARQANQCLVEEYRVPNEQIIAAPAGDAIAAWKALTEANLERSTDENAFYMCCGTKPHAIGMALRAMCLGHPQVRYQIPSSHVINDIRPSGRFWTFAVDDLASVL